MGEVVKGESLSLVVKEEPSLGAQNILIEIDDILLKFLRDREVGHPLCTAPRRTPSRRDLRDRPRRWLGCAERRAASEASPRARCPASWPGLRGSTRGCPAGSNRGCSPGRESRASGSCSRRPAARARRSARSAAKDGAPPLPGAPPVPGAAPAKKMPAKMGEVVFFFEISVRKLMYQNYLFFAEERRLDSEVEKRIFCSEVHPICVSLPQHCLQIN